MNYKIIILLALFFLSGCSDEKKPPKDDQPKSVTAVTPKAEPSSQTEEIIPLATDIFAIKDIDLLIWQEGGKDNFNRIFLSYLPSLLIFPQGYIAQNKRKVCRYRQNIIYIA
ncbi:MAG UNVERIFIED_CONTAM: hypothetical protein LVQ98_07090 [Rickettsiaceae bacterium]|jgi:hypothetical protein